MLLTPSLLGRCSTPEHELPTDAEILQATLSLADQQTLQTLADETPDSDEERLFLSYRAKRLAELQTTERKARFGRVEPVSRDDWAREITEGSKVPEPGTEEENVVRESGPEGEVEGGKKGTGVVVFLFKDGYVLLHISCSHSLAAVTLSSSHSHFPQT